MEKEPETPTSPSENVIPGGLIPLEGFDKNTTGGVLSVERDRLRKAFPELTKATEREREIQFLTNFTEFLRNDPDSSFVGTPENAQKLVHKFLKIDPFRADRERHELAKVMLTK